MSIRKLIPLLLALLLFAVLSFFLFTNNAPDNTEADTLPSIETVEDVPPLTIIEDAPIATDADIAAALETEAADFVDSLSAPQETSVIVGEDNQGDFVRYDGTITLPSAAQASGTTSTFNHDLAPDAAIPAAVKINGEGGVSDQNTVTSLKIQEIIQNPDIAANSLFYTHHVTAQDTQGLWGIIQQGLVDKFRAGMPLEGISQADDTVIIPHDADELLTSGLSSFLGKILAQKVDSSYVYNTSTKVMGRNPNVVHPGQQVVLIQFTEDELTSIYSYFADQRQQVLQTYAIPN